MVRFVAHCAVFKMIGALVINKEHARVECFDVTSNLSGVKHPEHLDHFVLSHVSYLRPAHPNGVVCLFYENRIEDE